MTRLDKSELMLLYDGTLEGFLSCVFEAYALHVVPQAIAPACHAQPALGQEVREVSTDALKAERVKVGLCNRAGLGAYEKTKRAFLADEPGRENSIFAFIVLCMGQGRRALDALDLEPVAKVGKLALRVSNEQEDMYQFVRFEELENGVFFATINPRNNVLPLVMEHFAARFNTQPFIIFDEVHHLAGVYDCKSHYLVPTSQISVPDRCASERQYQLMWKTFYDALSNELRYNPSLRTGNMPKRFWKNLTEMKLAVVSA